MKKIWMMALAAFVFASCESSLEDKALSIYADAKDKVEDATTVEELKQIKEDALKEALSLLFTSEKENVEALEDNEDFKKKRDEVQDAFEEAYEAKLKELKEKE